MTIHTLECRRSPFPAPTTGLRLAVVVALSAVVASCTQGDTDEAGTAPDTFTVAFETSAGDFEIEFVRAWSPAAVDRVFELASAEYWDGARFYRVNERYAQFGYSGDPEEDSAWVRNGIPDETGQTSNVRGTVSFARGGPATRSAILFVNRTDNSNLDALDWNGVLGFPPVGRVVSGMETVDALFSGYGDQPMQWEDSIAALGNEFLDRLYPELDSITDLELRAGPG